MPQKRMECFRLLFDHLAWIKHQFLCGIRDSRKAGSLWDDERCERSMEANTAELIGQRVRVRVLREFRKRFQGKRPALFKSGHWHFQQDNALVHNSIFVTDLAPCDFWLFSNLTGCRYETIEELKEAVTKVIEILTQEDFHGASQKLLERYKCIASGGYYYEGD